MTAKEALDNVDPVLLAAVVVYVLCALGPVVWMLTKWYLGGKP